eukprot:TRINITY_DN1099_c1_g1_i1.p2 TRINITY_DN1099_c1_g1~~TRINITY_DN1099_c1_g1_i1.p2  ORF type:complete len:138 (-),score=11.55 TRINITY_DN1099_c1_g1_i1:764-1135(-)
MSKVAVATAAPAVTVAVTTADAAVIVAVTTAAAAVTAATAVVVVGAAAVVVVADQAVVVAVRAGVVVREVVTSMFEYRGYGGQGAEGRALDQAPGSGAINLRKRRTHLLNRGGMRQRSQEWGE